MMTSDSFQLVSSSETAAAAAHQNETSNSDMDDKLYVLPSLLSFEAKKEEQNTVVSNSKGSLIPPSCSFEGEDPIIIYNTVANNQKV